MNHENTRSTMLSPILSQPRGSGMKNVPAKAPINSPISDVLNLADSASSLRQDFATCEMIMSEKHTILVSILDGMDQKVADIREKMLALQCRVHTLEKKQNLHILNAQQIFLASNSRQNDFKKLRDCASAINIYTQKCEVIDQLSARVAQIETREHPNQSNDI